MEAVLSPRGQITIPVSLRRKFGLRGGERVVIDEQGNDIVIRNSKECRVNIRRKTLKERLAEFYGENYPKHSVQSNEVDWGVPVGSEVW